MAQLKDTVVQGSLRVTDTTYTTNLNLSSGTASQIVKTDANKNLITGTLAASEIPNLSANKITSDTLSADRIPNLAASKINSGTFDAARIPNLSATKITSDTLGVDRIPNLAASKINSGTFDAARIPTLSITDKTSGTLTVARGGTYLTSITQGGIIYAASTSAYGCTSAGTANQILVSGGTGAPTWKATANGAAYATSSNGALTFGTLPVSQGGTGITTTDPHKVLIGPSTGTAAAAPTWRQISINEVTPIASKTYTAKVYGADGSGTCFYQNFMTVTPVDFNAIWTVTYRVIVTADGHSDYTATYDEKISGRSNTYYSWYSYNSLVSYPIYQHMILNSPNIDTPHEIGIRMASSYGDTSVVKKIQVDLLETYNCTAVLLDNLKYYTSATPSGFTWRTWNATSNGMQESGDTNDTGYYIVSNGFKGQAGSNKVYRYCLFARTGDGTYESFVMQDNTRATTKTANPHGFVPDGKIYWNSNNTVYNAGTLNLSAYEQYHVVDYLYSFNFNNTFLPDYCETYVVYTYNDSDGLLYLDTTQWLAAALPTTEDGKIYQRIGSKYYTGTSNYYQGSLLLDNPYYEYKNGHIQAWGPGTSTGGGSTYFVGGGGDTSIHAYYVDGPTDWLKAGGYSDNTLIIDAMVGDNSNYYKFYLEKGSTKVAFDVEVDGADVTASNYKILPGVYSAHWEYNSSLCQLWSIATHNLVVTVPITASSTTANIGTLSDCRIKGNMTVLHHELSQLAAQTSDWTIVTNNGSVVVNGTSGSACTLKLTLGYSIT